MMEMAKVTSKGQITIPISIRRRLGINEGDKILFINKQEGVLMLNPDTVGGDIAQYTEDAVALDNTSPAATTPVAAAAPEPSPAVAAAAPKPAEAPFIPSPQPDATIPAAPPPPATVASAFSAAPIEPQRRKYIPPVEEIEEKPAVQAGGIDLSTLLDDIRSIGSNI